MASCSRWVSFMNSHPAPIEADGYLTVMALVNNFFEIRADAFKMTVHFRRPIPTRTDSIGPWLDTLTFLTWLAALINAALVYLFSPASQRLLRASSNLHEKLFATVAQASPEAVELLEEGMRLVPRWNLISTDAHVYFQGGVPSSTRSAFSCGRS